MRDSYTLGLQDEWLKHSNEELYQLAKKRANQVYFWRSFCFLLLFTLGWVGYKYQESRPLKTLLEKPAFMMEPPSPTNQVVRPTPLRR